MSALLLKEKREKRAKAVADARAVASAAEAAKRELTTEERARIDAHLRDSQALKAEIEQLEGDERRRQQLEEETRELESSRGRLTDPAAPGGGAGGSGRGSGTPRAEMRWRIHEPAADVRSVRRHTPLSPRLAEPQYRDAFRAFVRDGRVGGLGEARDMLAGTDIEGGYLVAPMQVTGGLIRKLDDALWVRRLATVIPVTASRSLGAVSLDADPDDGEWVSEVQTGGNDTAMRLGRREMTPAQCSKLVKISNQLLRLVPDAESLVMDRLAYKFAVTQEKQFLVGDGANKPLGLFVASSSGISTARDLATGNTTTAITADNLVRCKYAVKTAYRARGVWMFHRDAVTQIALLKDGVGQYLWRQGISTAEPDTLLGRPVYESEYVPNTFTTGKYVGLFGDLSYYWIAEMQALAIQRLVELYALENKVGFIGRLWADGAPVLEEAFVRVKLA